MSTLHMKIYSVVVDHSSNYRHSEFIRKLLYWSVFLPENNGVHKSCFKSRKEFIIGNKQSAEFLGETGKQAWLSHSHKQSWENYPVPPGDSSSRGPVPLLITQYPLRQKLHSSWWRITKNLCDCFPPLQDGHVH